MGLNINLKLRGPNSAGREPPLIDILRPGQEGLGLRLTGPHLNDQTLIDDMLLSSLWRPAELRTSSWRSASTHDSFLLVSKYVQTM